MSRILIWSPNYAPELIGIPPLVTSAAEWLVERGHHVDVVTAVPNYPERVIRPDFRGRFYSSSVERGVAVHRSWLRVRPRESFLDKALYEWSFALLSLPRVLGRARRADVLVCVVPSLAAAALAAVVARPPRLVLWVQDLVGAAAGAVAPDARLRRLVEMLERTAFRRADRLVVCSPGFRDHAIASGVDPARVEVLYNWVDVDEIEASPPEPRDRTRFLYAGNLGYTQGFETLVEGARRLGDEVELEIVGSGNSAADVARLVGGNVTIREPVPRNAYPALLAGADVHVVVQRRISAGANLPSKIASYLASGRPILASIDASTPAAELLRESRAALIVEPEDPDAIATAMTQLHEDPDLRERLGGHGRAYAIAHLDRQSSLERFERVVLG